MKTASKTVGKVFLFDKNNDFIVYNTKNKSPASIKEFADAKFGNEVKVRWDKKCGCRCGCSPGFRIMMPAHLSKNISVKEYAAEFNNQNNYEIKDL